MKINVIKQRGLWWAVSGLFILIGLVAVALSWQRFQAPIQPSLDFIGGTRLQVEKTCVRDDSCEGSIDLATVRDILADQGLEGSSIQLLGDTKNALSIRTNTLDVDARSELLESLESTLGEFDPATSQIDTVGPIIGEQLFTAGVLALLVAFAGITVYLSLRFQFDYAVLALVALMHDLLITFGIFSILGLTIGYAADSLFIVALLTIVGFSVNDTVVIYDRIRETIKFQPELSINEVVDTAVNQTLGRSINTTLTTVLTLLSIVLFGGETLKFFALALIVGFLSGAYSSIFIASTLLAWWRGRFPQAPPPPAEEDELPSEGAA